MAPGAKPDLNTKNVNSDADRLASMLLIAGLIVIGGAVGVARIGTTLMVEPDTASYIGVAGFRSLGYPFFLYCLRSLGIPLEGVPWVQLALHLAVLPVLFGALRRATGSLWLTSAVVLLCYANPEVAKYHAKILSESLFLTVLVLFIAAFLAFVSEPSRRTLLLASLWVALGIAIKPVAWAFVVLLALVVIMRVVQRRSGIALLAAFLISLIAVVAMERVSSYLIHGSHRASLAPLHLFAKAGMVDADMPDAFLTDGPNASLHRALDRDAEAIRRLIDRAPDAGIARFLTVTYEVFLQYRFALVERQAIATEGDLGKAMTETGFERLRYGWPGYLRLTVRHYLGLWLLYDASHPARYQALNAFLAREKPLPFEASHLLEAQGAQSAGLTATIARPLVAAAGIATALLALLGIAALLLPDAVPLPWRQAGLLALGLHGYCLLVALTGVGIPRYLLGVWPLLLCSLGLAVAGVLNWWRERARR